MGLRVLLFLASQPAMLVLAMGEREENRVALVRRALDALHRERFDESLAMAAELSARFPDDPAGALSRANVYQTMMRDYRRRDHEAEFMAALAEGQRLADEAVRSRGDAEAHFARATARGYLTVYDSRRGRWFSALRQALHCVGDLNRAIELDPLFVDPLLPLGLHDYWKSRKLDLGVGLFRGARQRATVRIERVFREGRYLRVESAYSLATVHLLERRFDAALEVNDWLHERFPNNPVCLYHRALILEGLERNAEALAVWEWLIGRLASSGRSSQGFLAECHLHRARLHASLGVEAPAREALREAAAQARNRRPELELDGPFGSFDSVRDEIERLERRLGMEASPR